MTLPVLEMLKRAADGLHHVTTSGTAADALRELLEACSVYIQSLKAEIEVDEKLLQERERVLHAIPPCKVHGADCVPHALDWLQRMMQRDTLDTDQRVCFYEQEFYPLSNFSSFRLELTVHEGALHPRGTVKDFDTSEHAYHFLKFPGTSATMRAIRKEIVEARSAHDAFKVAERNREQRMTGWDGVKVGIMRQILRAKVDQHEYVRRKLLQTGDRELVENSWRDDFWGWGPNKDGQNMLGKLWMAVRDEIRLQEPKP